MRCQTSQYSLCISVPPFYFLYGQLFTFYMINFLLFIWSTFTFYMVNLSFYVVNFLLLIRSILIFIWSTQLFVWSVQKRRLQNRFQMQTEGKCRLRRLQIWGKMQTRFWKNQLFITTVSTWLQSAEQGVEHLEASDTEHQFQDATYLCSANWTTVQETGFYHPSNWKLPMWNESLSIILSRPNKVLHELHVCWSYLMLLNRTVYSLTREMHLAGCELHIQTLMFPIILTLKQYVNTKTIWGSEVQNINCHDHYCQPLKTYVVSIPAHSWSLTI